MSLYPKIESPFKRFTEGASRNKFDFSQWSRPEFQVLQHLGWTWTEKIDGTNVRVMWDGHKVVFGGRTDDAQMPLTLLAKLRALFPEELLEQAFGASEVVLYGEGYGARIQKGGGNYRPDQSFILFDVKIGNWWLQPDSLLDISQKLGIDLVPRFADGSVADAIHIVAKGLKSRFGDFWAEGLVGTAPLGILARSGERLMMKVKHKDLFTG